MPTYPPERDWETLSDKDFFYFYRSFEASFGEEVRHWTDDNELHAEMEALHAEAKRRGIESAEI